MAIGITMIAVVVMAKTIGCVLPLAAKKIGLDPAIMAAPLITTILDTCTILVYFRIVTAFFHTLRYIDRKKTMYNGAFGVDSKRLRFS